MKDPKQSSHHVTAPEDRVPFSRKVRYGCGAFADMTFQYAIFALAMPIFNLELGVSPVVIGMVLGFTRIWDAITDPMMGSISDNARTRFGRRRPFIAAGAILSGVFYAGVWFVPDGLSDTGIVIYFIIAVLLFYTSFTIFSVPFYAMGYEMSPDYHERTKVMGVRIFANSFNGIVFMPWIYWMIQRSFWENPMQGVRVVGIGVGLLMMILALIPALTIKEPVKTFVRKQERIPVFKSVKYTFTCKPFLYLVGGFIIALFAHNVVQSMFFYPVVYHVFEGDKEEASLWIALSDVAMHAVIIATVFLGAYISNKVGKRKACMFLASFVVIGSIVKIFCYNPAAPWLLLVPKAILGMGWSGLWVLVPAMIADVIDFDEWNTGTRREGMFGAVHSWLFKFAFSLGVMVSGFAIASTGFNVDLGINQPEGTLSKLMIISGVIPAIGGLIAIFFIHRYPITEDMAYGIRAKLEERRGVS